MNRNNTEANYGEDDHEEYSDPFEEFSEECAQLAHEHSSNGQGTVEYKMKVDAVMSIDMISDALKQISNRLDTLRTSISIVPHSMIKSLMKSFARSKVMGEASNELRNIADGLEQEQDVWNDMEDRAAAAAASESETNKPLVVKPVPLRPILSLRAAEEERRLRAEESRKHLSNE